MRPNGRTRSTPDEVTGAGSPAPNPSVVWLDEGGAEDPRRTGSKAAALARAAGLELPVVPGFVVTTAATSSPSELARALDEAVQVAWRRLSRDGEQSLVVRSSSTAEDLDGTSMAGRFTSVVGVAGWDAFTEAVRAVVASRASASAGVAGMTGTEPIAVLVQPLLDAAVGGVLFGVDPVTGRSDQMVVSVVEGGPDALVSGAVSGTAYTLDSRGRTRRREDGSGGARLSRRRLRRLARLAQHAADVFRGPQDIEWAIDRRGRLFLLQSRPVTTEVRGVPQGPLLGPGPVSETLPGPLAPLEIDLWVDPLREALTEALSLVGTTPRRKLERSPVVAVVDGRVAVDLELFGDGARARKGLSRLDPRAPARRVCASWRVGRLRAAVPGLAQDVLARADVELAAVPDLAGLTDRQLVALLRRAQQALRSLHGHEILVGLLLNPEASGLTGTSVALRALAAARADGMSDPEIIARNPVVLALVPPRVAGTCALPPTATVPPPHRAEDGDLLAVVREALRLRARWLQELTARAAGEAGRRLTASGTLADPDQVRRMRLDDLAAALCENAVPALQPLPEQESGSLPSRFRLSDRGRPVPVIGTGAGTGAGGGLGRGRVHGGEGEPAPGAVLVVGTLDPSLAPVLPRLGALVAETGSVLAHLAILAREAGVPTVVGLPDAVRRFPPGALVAVDGSTGEVELEEEEK